MLNLMRLPRYHSLIHSKGDAGGESGIAADQRQAAIQALSSRCLRADRSRARTFVTIQGSVFQSYHTIYCARYRLYSRCLCFRLSGQNSMFQPQHYGLYFTDESVQRARKQRDQEPFRSAWTLLRQRKPLDLLALAQHQGLLYRFDGDDEAGARAVRILEQDSPAPSQAAGFVEAAATVMTWA